MGCTNHDLSVCTDNTQAWIKLNCDIIWEDHCLSAFGSTSLSPQRDGWYVLGERKRRRRRYVLKPWFNIYGLLYLGRTINSFKSKSELMVGFAPIVMNIIEDDVFDLVCIVLIAYNTVWFPKGSTICLPIISHWWTFLWIYLKIGMLWKVNI